MVLIGLARPALIVILLLSCAPSRDNWQIIKIICLKIVSLILFLLMKGVWQAWRKSWHSNPYFTFWIQISQEMISCLETSLLKLKFRKSAGKLECDWCELSIIHIWFQRKFYEILLGVKVKLMLFEGVGLIFTGACVPFYQLWMNFII